MRPRILLRTHYQADEPRLIITAATHFASPSDGRDEDHIANALERWARSNGYSISTPGAVYAVGNARQLGLLGNSNRWTSSALAFAFVERMTAAKSQVISDLSPLEERLYLSLYLEGAGAILIKFGAWLLRKGVASEEELRRGEVVEKLVIDALDDYLKLTDDIRERTGIRSERDRLKRTKYSPITQRHKRRPLLRTMRRLHLLEEELPQDSSASLLRPDSAGRLEALIRVVPDTTSLERLIKEGKLRTMLDIEMQESFRRDLGSVGDQFALILDAYGFAMGRGMHACPLAYLDDVLWAAFPVSPGQSQKDAETLLEPLHKANPGEVRFHVDRRGRRAFVIIGARAIKSLAIT